MGTSKMLLSMAARNVRRNLLHSLAAVLSIVVGFVAMGLFEGYIGDLAARQMEAFTRRQMYGELLVEREGASGAEGRDDPLAHALGPDEQAVIDAFLARHAGEVEERVRFLRFAGLAGAGRSAAVFVGLGHDVAEGERIRGRYAWNAVAGRPLEDGPASTALLGKGLGALFDCVPASDAPTSDGDGYPLAVERPLSCPRGRLTLTATTAAGRLNVIEPKIAGLVEGGLKELDQRLVVVPLGVAQRLLDTTSVSQYSVKLRDPARAAALAEELRAEARAAGLALDVRRFEEHPSAELLRRGLDLLGIYRTFVVLVVVTVAGMSVLTTMMKSVAERTREIGTLRSLGLRRRHIVSLFCLEAALLSAVGSAAGLALTVALASAVDHAGIRYSAGVLAEPIPLRVALAPGAYVAAALFLAAVAVAAAFWPARRAAHGRISEALATP